MRVSSDVSFEKTFPRSNAVRSATSRRETTDRIRNKARLAGEAVGDVLLELTVIHSLGIALAHSMSILVGGLH